jgi:hypothetical protein
LRKEKKEQSKTYATPTRSFLKEEEEEEQKLISSHRRHSPPLDRRMSSASYYSTPATTARPIYLPKPRSRFLATGAARLPSRVLAICSLSWPLLSGGLFSLPQPLQGYPCSIAPIACLLPCLLSLSLSLSLL